MNIVAFGASTSRRSINRLLAAYAASCIPNSQVELLDLNDFEMPIYSQDREEEHGYPAALNTFLERVRQIGRAHV